MEAHYAVPIGRGMSCGKQCSATYLVVVRVYQTSLWCMQCVGNAGQCGGGEWLNGYLKAL